MAIHTRRRFLAGCAGLLLAADWPQHLGPQRNGVSPESDLAETWPAGGPRRLWEKKVGEGLSGPVVADGRLILFHRVEDRELVECLDAATGTVRWQFPYPTGFQDQFGIGDAGPRSTPVLTAQHVYTLGAEGRLHCLDAATGKKVWERNFPEQYQAQTGYFGVATSPLVEGKLLLVNVGGRGASIVAFDRETGQEVWKCLDHEASYSSPVAFTHQGKRRVVFFTREGIVLLDPATGQVLWNKRWRARIQASVNAATPLISDDQLFVSASYNTGAILLRLDGDKAETVWSSDEVLSNHYNTGVIHQGLLYGIDGRQEGGARLRCVELRTGKVHWTREDFGCAALLVAGKQLLAWTDRGELVRIEPTPTQYKELARAKLLDGACRALPALADGRFHARDKGRLGCWSLKG